MSRAAGELFVYDSPSELAAALADLFATSASRAIAARGRFAVALAGGTTPKAAYALLAQPRYASQIDWHDVEVFFGDERCVPPDDPQSNYRMAREAFLGSVDIPAENVHRMQCERDPADAASAYAGEVRRVLGAQPRFDLVMLGMGPDGHTASLFPGSDPYEGDDMLARAVYSTSQRQWRVTLTPSVLNAARTVVFAVEGSSKATMLHRVREGEYDPTLLPSQSICPHDGRLLWLVDRAAAGG